MNSNHYQLFTILIGFRTASPDLPISSGSWKFHGLPELILKADDTTGMHRFEAYLLLKGKGLTINEVSDAGGI